IRTALSCPEESSTCCGRLEACGHTSSLVLRDARTRIRVCCALLGTRVPEDEDEQRLFHGSRCQTATQGREYLFQIHFVVNTKMQIVSGHILSWTSWSVEVPTSSSHGRRAVRVPCPSLRRSPSGHARCGRPRPCAWQGQVLRPLSVRLQRDDRGDGRD